MFSRYELNVSSKYSHAREEYSQAREKNRGKIVPDRQLCARYNVKIDDVTRLINTALGGDPIGVLYEDDRRFDIVAKLDRRTITSPEAIGKLPVHGAQRNDGISAD